MLREHAPLIAVAAVLSIALYLTFRSLQNLRLEVQALKSQVLTPLDDDAGDDLPPTPLNTPARLPAPSASPAPETAAAASEGKPPGKRA